jgi:hypothetical protein
VQWGEVLPINVNEEMQADKLALDMGIIDQETIATKWFIRYGVDWETIEANKEKNKPEPLQGITPDVMPQDNTPQDNNAMDNLNTDKAQA